jgi:hypothetical protein
MADPARSNSKTTTTTTLVVVNHCDVNSTPQIIAVLRNHNDGARQELHHTA